MVPILTNHIGYDCGDTKNAVYQRQSDETPVSFPKTFKRMIVILRIYFFFNFFAKTLCIISHIINFSDFAARIFGR